MKCAIYTRVSTDNQVEVEFNSCEAQEAKIRSFIKSQENMEVFKVYSDPGFTGANLNRPALQELLNDVRKHRINLVISYKIDRLTRSPKDFYQLIELFDKFGGVILYLLLKDLTPLLRRAGSCAISCLHLRSLKEN